MNIGGLMERFRRGIGGYAEARRVIGVMEGDGFIGTMISEGRTGKVRRYAVAINFEVVKWYRSRVMAKKRLWKEYQKFLKKG